MQTNESQITALEDRWIDVTNLSLCQSPINAQLFHRLICDTYRTLALYDTNESISKKIASILILMSEFSAYSLMSEDTEGYNHIISSYITQKLLWGFVRGFKNSGTSYPFLELPDYYNVRLINLETDDLYMLQINVDNVDDVELPF